MGIILKCKNCNKEYEICASCTPRTSWKYSFCSTECYNIYKKNNNKKKESQSIESEKPSDLEKENKNSDSSVKKNDENKKSESKKESKNEFKKLNEENTDKDKKWDVFDKIADQ